MKSQREVFLSYLAQTSKSPLEIEIQKSEGVYLYGVTGEKYLDLISGISVSSIGHQHPEIVKAIKDQVDKFMHVMVYGELILAPQVDLAKKLAELLPASLNNCYFVNSGSEAVEGALKLAKRFTGRPEIICFKNAYHGSTSGALSLISQDNIKDPFRPLIPGIRCLDFNDTSQLTQITENTAAVIFEFIQGEGGAIPGNPDFFNQLALRCHEKGTLLIADEAQTGMRRTGKFFSFIDYNIVPDILILAKAFGGGLPLAAFISNRSVMDSLTHNPPLGHITTFGGHPVCCASALAAIEIISRMTEKEILEKEKLIRQLLVHPAIIRITGKGMLLGIEFENDIICQQVIKENIKNGILTDWFLFAPQKMRIAPPLTIS